MCKKLYFLISLVLLLSLANSAMADPNTWLGGMDADYMNPFNWSPMGVPASIMVGDVEMYENGALIQTWNGTANVTPSYWPVLSATAPIIREVQMGYDSAVGNYGELEIATGGVLETTGDVRFGYNADTSGVLNITGGTLIVGDDLYIGKYGDAVINMSDGYFRVTDASSAWAKYATGSVDFNLSGGIMDFDNWNTGTGTVDFTISDDGVFKLLGDQIATVLDLVNSGVLHGPEGVVYYYDAGEDKTIVIPLDPNIARTPSPSSGSTIVGSLDDANNVYTALDFTPGDFAVSHEAFFSDVEADVNAREGSVSLGTQVTTTYYVGRSGDPYNQSLVRGTWYYWCVDEFDGTDTWPGRIWSFYVSPAKASDPVPEDGRKFINLTPKLCWTAGPVVEEHDVYFGTTFADVNDANKLEGDPEFMGTQLYTDTTWDPDADGGLTLQYNTDYYWRIDEARGTIKGDVWSFTTLDAGMEGTNAGRGAYIILITKSADGELVELEPFLNGLYEGVSIEAVNQKYRSLHDEYEGGGIDRAHLRANLKSANLIIISDSSSAGEYDDIEDIAPAEGANLALNQLVDSSSNEVVDEVELVPGNAVDGNTLSRWASEASDPQWIYVDLGEELTVGAVRLDWENAYGKSYQIQVSNNASDWGDVYSTTSGDGGIERIYFEDVTARYVRMYGTERGTAYGYSLWEFGVYESGTLPQEFNETEFWNGLETPILLTTDDFGRSTNWSWFDASGENDWAMEEDGGYMYVNNMCDQIWDYVTIEYGDPCRVWMFYWGWIDSPPEVPECNSAGYGTLLATADVVGADAPQLVLARWIPGTQFWDDPSNPQTAGGPRIFFAMESFDAELGDGWISPDGEKMMENMITELLQYTFDPNFAYAPYPKLNATDVPKDVPLVLQWSPGDNVGLAAGGGENGHKVYFSSIWADVNDHNEAALVGDPNFRDSNELEPPIYLDYGQTYYWCVDEYNDTHPDSPWLGHIWSFTMVLSVTGEDWEDYISADEMRAYWSYTGLTTLGLETGTGDIVHGGAQAMSMRAEWEVGEATRTFIPSTEWAETNKAMGVWFYGDAANVLTGAQLYLTIEDGYANSHTVNYDGNMNNLAEENWHQWAIDLADFRGAGVDLLAVKKVILGFGNGSEASSWIYFDDIELFEWMCLAPPAGDFSGPAGIPDCVVDTWDLGALSDVWLEHEYYIYAEPVTDDPCAYWDFEEGAGSEVADVTGNGNIGRFLVDCNYPDGYDYDSANKPEWVAGKMGNWALQFDGNDFIRVEGTEGATIECANEPYTMGFWMNYDEDSPSMYIIFKGCDKEEDWPKAYDQSPWDASARRTYSLEFGPGGAEGDSSLNMYLDDDDGKCNVLAGELDMDPNVWYHVAFQRDWDAAKIRIYLNAELVGEGDDESQTSYISSDGEPLFIGMKNSRRDSAHIGWHGNRFVGKLDDISLYKSVLSSEELLSVMGLSERIVPVHHTEFNLVEDWIINFEDAAIMAENWGVETRFP